MTAPSSTMPIRLGTAEPPPRAAILERSIVMAILCVEESTAPLPPSETAPVAPGTRIVITSENRRVETSAVCVAAVATGSSVELQPAETTAASTTARSAPSVASHARTLSVSTAPAEL